MAGFISLSQPIQKDVQIVFTDDVVEFYQERILIAIAEK